ncbi:choline transporter-like protein 1 [Planococcus citri]|uniref:choline transporter-like protein 1 n=1 Tax=Planococcus citri TaxID=170843 RepID=UPI0031F8D9F8
MDYSKMQDPSINTYPSVPVEFPSSSMKNELIKEDHAGPTNKRKPTNVEFLVVFGITVAIWLLLNFYCMCNGDLSRLDTKSLQNGTTTNDFKEFATNIRNASGEIYLACSSAVVLSALLIVLFRRFAGTIVWFVVGLVLTVMGISTVGAWYGFFINSVQTADKGSKLTLDNESDDNASAGVLVGAVSITFFTLIIAVLIYAIRKHIRLVIRLFKEGGKVTQSMPLILAQPFVTFVVLIIVLFLFVYFALWIESSGFPQTNENGVVEYEKNDLMNFAAIFNVLVVWWIVQFVIGCQNMVIAGATATWYFTRDKTRVNNAIRTSYRYLLKYHLGSVALGSLIITTIQILRRFYEATMRKNARNIIGCLLSWLLKYIERFFTFLTRNAYIEIAIYGDGFFVSGKRAFQVLTNNAIKVATINSVGDFVMVLGRLLVTGLAVLIGFLLLQGRSDITNSAYPLGVIAIVSFAIVHAFMLAFEMIVDSVFICFCEDCDINDGVQRPYYMSKEMMVFMNKEDPKVLRVGDAAAE